MTELKTTVDTLNIYYQTYKKELCMHEIFAYTKHISKIKNDIKIRKIDADRKKIGILFLQEKYKAIVLNLAKFIHVYSETDIYYFKNTFANIITDIIADYEIGFLIALQQEFGKTKGQKIYDIVYTGDGSDNTQTQGFDTLHSNQISFLRTFIDNQSKLLTDIEKVLTFFDMCQAAYILSRTYIINRLENINGLLTIALQS